MDYSASVKLFRGNEEKAPQENRSRDRSDSGTRRTEENRKWEVTDKDRWGDIMKENDRWADSMNDDKWGNQMGNQKPEGKEQRRADEESKNRHGYEKNEEKRWIAQRDWEENKNDEKEKKRGGDEAPSVWKSQGDENPARVHQSHSNTLQKEPEEKEEKPKKKELQHLSQEELMRQAAERAIQRKVEEERKRKEQAENARRKALEIEKRMESKKDSPISGILQSPEGPSPSPYFLDSREMPHSHGRGVSSRSPQVYRGNAPKYTPPGRSGHLPSAGRGAGGIMGSGGRGPEMGVHGISRGAGAHPGFDPMYPGGGTSGKPVQIMKHPRSGSQKDDEGIVGEKEEPKGILENPNPPTRDSDWKDADSSESVVHNHSQAHQPPSTQNQSFPASRQIHSTTHSHSLGHHNPNSQSHFQQIQTHSTSSHFHGRSSTSQSHGQSSPQTSSSQSQPQSQSQTPNVYTPPSRQFTQETNGPDFSSEQHIPFPPPDQKVNGVSPQSQQFSNSRNLQQQPRSRISQPQGIYRHHNQQQQHSTLSQAQNRMYNQPRSGGGQFSRTPQQQQGRVFAQQGSSAGGHSQVSQTQPLHPQPQSQPQSQASHQALATVQGSSPSPSSPSLVSVSSSTAADPAADSAAPATSALSNPAPSASISTKPPSGSHTTDESSKPSEPQSRSSGSGRQPRRERQNVKEKGKREDSYPARSNEASDSKKPHAAGSAKPHGVVDNRGGDRKGSKGGRGNAPKSSNLQPDVPVLSPPSSPGSSRGGRGRGRNDFESGQKKRNEREREREREKPARKGKGRKQSGDEGKKEEPGTVSEISPAPEVPAVSEESSVSEDPKIEVKQKLEGDNKENSHSHSQGEGAAGTPFDRKSADSARGGRRGRAEGGRGRGRRG